MNFELSNSQHSSTIAKTTADTVIQNSQFIIVFGPFTIYHNPVN